MVDETNARPAGVLNLDELFGASRPIKVEWQGVRYSLRRPEAMGPAEIVKLERLQERYEALGAATAQDGVEPHIVEIEGCVDDMIGIWSEELAAQHLPFLAKTKIMQFWLEQVHADEATNGGPSKKGQRRRIGAMRSRS